MKKLLILLLSLGLGTAIYTQVGALYPPTTTTDSIFGNVISLENGIATGDFVTNSGARNIVDLETGLQLGANAQNYVPNTKVVQLSNGSHYTLARNISGDIVAIHLLNPSDSWVELPFPAGVGPDMSTCTCFNFGIMYVNEYPGFWYSRNNGALEAKFFIYHSGGFIEKYSLPLAANNLLTNVVNTADNQLFYGGGNWMYYMGDIVFDTNADVILHNQIDTRITDSFRSNFIQIIKEASPGQLLLGVSIKDEITNVFHKKIFAYDTNISTPDNQKLIELAEVYSLDEIEITSTQNGFYLFQQVTDYQWIKLNGQNQMSIDNGIYSISQPFNQIVRQTTGDVSLIAGIPNDSYFQNEQLHYACDNDQLGLVYNDGSYGVFGGVVVFSLDPPFVPTFVSAFSSSIPATVYVGDMFDPNISVASPATDSSFYIDVEEETGEVIAQISGEFLATKAGTVMFTAYALDAGGYSDSWTVTILDTATVDTTTTAISNALPEDFNILNNRSGGNITIQTNDFGQYNIVVYNMLGQNLLVQDFTNEIKIDLSIYDKGIFPIVIMKDGAVFTTKLHN